MNTQNLIFEIEGKPRRKGLKKLRSYVALYDDRIVIELDGNRDVYTRDDIIDIFIKEPVMEDIESRETYIEYYEEGEQCDYTLEDDTFPGLAERMERALEREWAFVGEKRAYTDTVKWFNAANAVTMIAGQQNPAIFGGAYKNPNDVSSWREVLYASWQINNRSQLLAWLPKLLDGRAAKIYKAQRMVLDGADMQEAMERFAGSFDKDDLSALRKGIFTAGFADGNKESDEWAIFDDIAQNGGERCLLAWDLQRLIYLSAMGFGADFLSWDEAMDWCVQAGQKLQEIFSGWDAFVRSYLLGYCSWASERIDDEDSEAYERKNIYETYRKLRNSPWQVEWETALVKA